ncbi:lantibiotic dehydratase [Brevibacillus sp. H7]|uniref:lantibiotic dehydratase n=1 Tax=Brevibacillus sp. H7 TaxID=3349138 RepID=UPI003813977C
MRELCRLRSGTYDEIIVQLSNRFDLFQQYLNEQWIRPIFPYSRKERHALMTIAAMMKTSGSKRGRRIARVIRLIALGEAKLAAGSAENRLRLQTCIRHGLRSIALLLHQPEPDYVKKGTLVYEDVRTDQAAEPIGKHVKQDLHRLGEWMRPYLFRSHRYDLLVEHFVERYGPGGTCYDLEEFLYSFDRRKDRPRLIERARSKDLEMISKMDEGRIFSPISPSAAPPNTAVCFQLAATKGIEGIRNGEYTMVVNRLNTGLGGLFARYLARFDKQHGNLLRKLLSWLRTMYPEASIVDFPANADFNRMQIDYGVTKQALRWTGENPTLEPMPDLMLKDVCLIHTEENTLTLIGRDGRPISPQYLGSIPYDMLQGTVAYFLMLITPWTNAFPVGWTNRMHPMLPPPDQIEFHPREQRGRLVLRRACWRIPLYRFPRKEPGESDFAFFRRMKEWQLTHGIPEEVFISGEYRRDCANRRPPMWISFRSYHSLDAALPILFQEDLLYISLTEALPDRREHWFTGSDGFTYATEYVALLNWPRTRNDMPFRPLLSSWKPCEKNITTFHM